jgi:CheY-like chemotaxis protein
VNTPYRPPGIFVKNKSMAKFALPIFTRDHRTGLLKELAPDEPDHFALASVNPGPSHIRVLVADADETGRRCAVQHLGKAWPVEQDLTVECASDGIETLEKIRSRQFALVVLNWNISGPDGTNVLRTVRDSGLHVPVIVVSGERREDIAQDLDSMTAAFVNKEKMDAFSFRKAIVSSMLLQAGVFGLLRSGILNKLIS